MRCYCHFTEVCNCLGLGLMFWYNLRDGKGTLGSSGSGTRGGGMDWIDLAQDRDRWQAVVNVVMNLRVL